MSENTTTNLTSDDKLNRILAELSYMKDRMMKVEAYVDDRSRDTRPLLGQMQKEIADFRVEVVAQIKEANSELKHINRKLDVLNRNPGFARHGK
jgi:hypothetical protein